MSEESYSNSLYHQALTAKDPFVRDLLWLLAAPDLVTTQWQGKPTLDQLGLTPSCLINKLNQPQTKETPYWKAIQIASQKRLGLYHEALWHCILDLAPAIELLAQNFPIRDSQRTLGELDIIYRHRPSGQIIHLEVAIKYYLGLPEGPEEQSSFSRWIGPAGVDSLAIKAGHSEQRQLPLSDHPLARQQLAHHLNISSANLETGLIEKQLALPGVLFYPWQGCLRSPHGVHYEHYKGWWLRLTAWSGFCEALPSNSKGCLLKKPHWLAPPYEDQLQPLCQLDQQLSQHFNKQGGPLQLAIKTDEGRWVRVFIVSDSWPLLIPLPPRSW